MLPNLIIAGAQKSGTTSLHHLLKNHRDIFFPERPQEIHYFDLEKNFRRGRGWYEALFDRWSGETYCAQTSPLYMYLPEVASRIRDLLPEARIIFILRHPVDRAYSHYWHEGRFGFEPRPFPEALELEGERIVESFQDLRQFSYLDRGRYARQIRPYFELFGRDRCLVLLFDDLKQAPNRVRRQVADFLGIAFEGFAHKKPEPWHFNRTRVPRIWTLQRIRRRFGRASWLGYALDAVNLRKNGYPAMEPSLRERLVQQFLPEIEALEELTGLDLGQWQDGRQSLLSSS